MKKRFYLPLFLLSVALLLCSSVVSVGQNRDRYIISAKAGGINAITGGATVSSRSGSSWQQLMVTYT